MATWNVRSPVENAGDKRIYRRRPQEALSNPQAVDRKLDLLMKELRRYRVSVGAIQETKWFSSDIWQARVDLSVKAYMPFTLRSTRD